ncbi:histidine kinase [Azorhizobium oxalatiphilum]|uniref:Histidine kinase n=2 Tax=Azorhizobium oxalatiphilum TaxID=980631 RepID=A0A917FG07_9HYPH|nr:histidine kinase [Azorhizobium oxalatiphilum]
MQAALAPKGMQGLDFTKPAGEPALAAPDSVSWRVFKNPAALFIGGVSAVILELAEPRVRAGVWDHTSFRSDPVPRLQRTGLAAMITVYAARSVAEEMIAGVGRRHARVTGKDEHGAAYRADDPDLLDWVQATASFGFMEAYHRFAAPLSPRERDLFFAEAEPAARLYGATGAPRDVAEWEHQLDAMLPALEPSPIIGEFLEIMHRAPAMPLAARPMQGLMLRAAVEILPAKVRAHLGLDAAYGLAPWQMGLVRGAVRTMERVFLPSAPPARACVRMGLPPDHLWRR